MVPNATSIWVGLLVVGILFAAIPFILSLLLNVKSVGVPDKFREYDEIWKSMASSFYILIITLPMAVIVEEILPNVYAYLMAASTVSFIIPLCYNIAWAKINATATIDDLKRRNSTGDSSPRDEKGIDSLLKLRKQRI